jgi:poly-gamma-glutamate synthase PgsB/CapB
MNRARITEILAKGLNLYQRKLHTRLLEETAREYLKRPDPWMEEAKDDHQIARRLLSFLRGEAEQSLQAVFALRKRYAEYTKRYSRAMIPEERERHIFEFARDLGRTKKELHEDRKAFARWFGHDAMIERYSRRHNALERRLSFLLDRMGMLAEFALAQGTGSYDLLQEWRWLALETTLKPLFVYDGDARVIIAAFRALARALRALPPEVQERSVDTSTLQFIYRSAMHPRLEVWLQCEALSLLESLSPASLEKVIVQRLNRHAPGDDLFVRRRAVLLIGRNLARIPGLLGLFGVVADDPSPFVRQALAGALVLAPADEASKWFLHLTMKDPVPQVRAAALLESLKLLKRPELQEEALWILSSVFEKETDPFVLRVAGHVAAEGAAQLRKAADSFFDPWQSAAVASLERLHTRAESIPVKRWAALARERIWCEADPRARALKGPLKGALAGMGAAERRILPRELLLTVEEDVLGRVLAVLGQENFGYELEKTRKGTRVTRGHVFGFRLWRFLHEIRSPSPDKRQAFRHTIGRLFRGNLRAPSAILSELAETRVPGEPLFIAEEGGWRPYLPLLDEVISSLRQGREVKPVKLYTSEGITEILPPDSPRGRLKAFYRITTRFPSYAKLRNWRSQLQESPSTYLRALGELGFRFDFRPHTTGSAPTSVDPSVQRFFPAILPLWLWPRLKEYFVSVYDNSLQELLLFAGAATAFFLGRHIYANASVRRCRKRMPLVVGGWGTRGKSGTERLKAALFNALGYGVVSKTTGCEAMFLFAHAFGKMREMFLFRSYDKATIWEQRNVLRIADQLGAEAFLWECMALTPSYVDILQHHWVRDDLSTITNTYPDHEDLQGPAGINIPEVIAIFLPHKARAITSEDQMLPILVEAARKFETSLKTVSWLEAGLIAPDLIKRFPYDEHPYNIALVLALAEEIGIERDFALKEMADRVVPDLGVLKTFPISRVRGRRLQFANGCSANERHGTISNWIRLGFNVQDPVAEPGVWITTVVNNRADRVPRSRVFARILVEDIYADRHFLIGGNLTGLVGYIRQSWDAYAPTVSLWPKDSTSDPGSVLLEMARRFRQPTEEAHVAACLRAMLLGQGQTPETVDELCASSKDPAILRKKLEPLGLGENLEATLQHHQQNQELLLEYQGFGSKIRKVGAAERQALDQEFRDLLWKWFQRKLVVVHDYYISGDQLNNLIAGETPPGYLNRVMGVQNIKGTGLDFVYRWQAWDACYKACMQLGSQEAQVAEQGLKALAAFHEYGVLSEELVRETLEKTKSFAVAQSESFQAELAMIVSNFEEAMKELKQKLTTVKKKSSRLERVIHTVEAFFDAGDAVKRRKRANQIYKDLFSERISSERAALELQLLNKRQKGGWLLQKLESAQSAVAKNVSSRILRRMKGGRG